MEFIIDPKILGRGMSATRRNYVAVLFGVNFREMGKKVPITYKDFRLQFKYAAISAEPYLFALESIILFIETYPGLKEWLKPSIVDMYKTAVKMIKEEKKSNR